MNLAHQIVDMATLAATPDDFVVVYDLPNGGKLSVSRNSLTGRGVCALSSLPIDAYGVELWDQLQTFQTPHEVADRLTVLSE